MNITNLFDNQMNKFGFVTVMDMVFKDTKTNEPVLKLDTLKMSNVSVDGSEKEIRGGKGNGLLLNYGYGRTGTVEMEDVLASMSSLQFLFGAKEDSVITRAYNEKVLATATGVELSETAIDGTVYGYGRITAANGDITDFIVSDAVLAGTLAYSTVGVETATVAADVEGALFDIYYDVSVTPDETHKSISLGSADFPKAYRAVGQTFIIDQETGDKTLMEIEFPKFKLGPSFALTLQGDGDASTFKFDGKALEGDDGKFYRLKFLGTYNEADVI